MLIPRRFCSNFSASNVRKSFINYFQDQGHVHVPSSSVIPKNDDSLLFVNAGMNQAEEMPQGKTRVVNSQKCIRAGGKHNDLEDVGKDNYHHTFFEMLGNWSFGDYYKKEACEYAWNYLTEILKIPGSRLYVTFFKGDSKLNLEPDLETFEIWKKIGLPVDRIIPSGAKDNFWEMAEFGPCGPCSEIHIDKKEDRPYSVPDLVNKDHPEVVELWNIVFMQYDKKRDSISNLPRKNIDCGMGFERLVSVLQKVDSNYDTDVFQPILKNISLFSKIGPYSGKLGKEDENEKDKAYRIIADHLRTVTISLADGVSPAGTDRGFVVRKMLRRAAMNSTNILKVERNSLSEISKSVILNLKDAYPELKENEEIIRKTIGKEEKNFWNIVDQGKKIFESMVSKLPKKASVFPGELAFELHDTYGFNIELTQKFAEKQGLNVDLEGFQKRREEASRLAKSQSKMKAMFGEIIAYLENYGWFILAATLLILFVFYKYIKPKVQNYIERRHEADIKKFDTDSRDRYQERMRIAREQQYEQFVKENEEKKLRKEQEKERERLVEETPKTPPKTVASNSTDDPYEFVAKKITGKKVVIFSKKTCPYCMKAKQALSVYRIPRDHYEIVELDDLPAGKVENIQKVLGEMTGASTVPRVFIDGNCLGGGDDTVQALTSGKLAQLLKEAGAI